MILLSLSIRKARKGYKRCVVRRNTDFKNKHFSKLMKFKIDIMPENKGRPFPLRNQHDVIVNINKMLHSFQLL